MVLTNKGEPEGTHNVQVTVRLIEGQDYACPKQNKSCGSFSTFKTCVSSCGLGSGGTDR